MLHAVVGEKKKFLASSLDSEGVGKDLSLLYEGKTWKRVCGCIIPSTHTHMVHAATRLSVLRRNSDSWVLECHRWTCLRCEMILPTITSFPSSSEMHGTKHVTVNKRETRRASFLCLGEEEMRLACDAKWKRDGQKEWMTKRGRGREKGRETNREIEGGSQVGADLLADRRGACVCCESK